MAFTSAAGVISLIRTRIDDSSLSDTQVLDLMNDAKRAMQRRYPLRWQETYSTAFSLTVPASTVDFRTATPPSDYKAIRAIHFVESGTYRTIKYDPDFFGLVDALTGATSATHPDYWSQWGDTLYLFPKNSVTWELIVFYEKMLADYTAVAAVDNFLTYAPEVLQYETMGEYYDSIAEDAKGRIWHAKAERAMQLLLTQHRSSETHALDPIPTTPGRIRQRRPLSYWEEW